MNDHQFEILVPFDTLSVVQEICLFYHIPYEVKFIRWYRDLPRLFTPQFSHFCLRLGTTSFCIDVNFIVMFVYLVNLPSEKSPVYLERISVSYVLRQDFIELG